MRKCRGMTHEEMQEDDMGEEMQEDDMGEEMQEEDDVHEEMQEADEHIPPPLLEDNECREVEG